MFDIYIEREREWASKVLFQSPSLSQASSSTWSPCLKALSSLVMVSSPSFGQGPLLQHAAFDGGGAIEDYVEMVCFELLKKLTIEWPPSMEDLGFVSNPKNAPVVAMDWARDEWPLFFFVFLIKFAELENRTNRVVCTFQTGFVMQFVFLRKVDHSYDWFTVRLGLTVGRSSPV